MKMPKLSDLNVDVQGTKEIRKIMKEAKKIKITANVDESVVMNLKELAEETGVPYQTLMNKLLKESLETKRKEEKRLDKIERELDELKKRLGA